MGDTMGSVVGRLLRDERGEVYTEYLVVTGLVALTFVAAMVALGPQLVESYQRQRNNVAHPFP